MDLIKAITQILSSLDIHPVLVDIGASGAPPEIWSPIAPHAIYVGFDADQRDLHEPKEHDFFSSMIINKAVICDNDQQTVDFFLTASPHCSSTLAPNPLGLAGYLFAELFQVVGNTAATAVTLNQVAQTLSLPQIDWFKSDSQGTDLRLFNSLSNELRTQVLAVDMEPGFIDAYTDEDLFVDVHRDLVQQGFWLSNISVHGSVRMQRSTLATLQTQEVKDSLHGVQRRSPGWCEVRYLRTLEWLAQHDMPAQRYILLWLFALIDEQFGFALDVATAYSKRFGSNNIGNDLRQIVVSLLQEKAPIVKKRRFMALRKYVKQYVRFLSTRY